MFSCFKLSLIGVGALIGSVALAQSSLYDHSAGLKLSSGESRLILGASTFSSPEVSPYGRFSYENSFMGRSFTLRGTFAKKETAFGSVMSGGTDFELLTRFQYAKWLLSLGVAIPNTPAQEKIAGTFQVGIKGDLDDEGGSVLAAVSGVTSKDVTLVAFGAGLTKNVMGGLGYDASATFILRGQNTVDVGTGQFVRQPLFDLGLRYQTTDRMMFRVGYGNSLGNTTGLALTPNLGSGAGFSFSVGMKF